MNLSTFDKKYLLLGNGLSLLIKVGNNHTSNPHGWEKILPKDIAGSWCCGCWFIPCGLGKFQKLEENEDLMTHTGFCCFNGICAPFTEKRHRFYHNGMPTNGFYKEDDPNNIDWYKSHKCVGNGSSLSCKLG